MQKNQQEAKTEVIRRWSAIWIVPIVTALIGITILFYYFSQLGVSVTLVTNNAEGIVADKTVIKSHNVDVGTVESVHLSDDLSKAIVKIRLNRQISYRLDDKTKFWIVSPNVSLRGVSGLNTLLSGSYIQIEFGSKNDGKIQQGPYVLENMPPPTSFGHKGIVLKLTSHETEHLITGAPIHYRGVKVGSVENVNLDANTGDVIYQIFIAAPYDKLVNSNVRFWEEGGINLGMSNQGIQLNLPSLGLLLSNGISFGLPTGASPGAAVKPEETFQLYSSKQQIDDLGYTEYQQAMLLFSGSIRGLMPGDAVEYQGLRIGTVEQVPYKDFYRNATNQDFFTQRIPVLIHIEPQRVPYLSATTLWNDLLKATKKGLRASIKSSNLVLGGQYIDLSYLDDVKPWNGPTEMDNIPVIPTAITGLGAIQDKLVEVLDKINKAPVTQTVTQIDNSFKSIQQLTQSLNKLVNHKDIQQLPKDFGNLLRQLNEALQNLQPGTELHSSIAGDLRNLQKVLGQMNQLLSTLNSKSNALIFEAKTAKDPIPKAATKN